MNLIKKDSGELAKVGKSISITNKILKEIEGRVVVPGDDFRVSIPNLNFQKYLIDEFCVIITNGTVAYGEIKNIEEINCSLCFLNISSFKGIEYFTSLRKLLCAGNSIIDLDLSLNKALIFLSCGMNKLTELDISNNTALVFLDCGWNQLTELNVSHNIVLTTLACDYNQLTQLDVSQNTALSDLGCINNKLTELDVSNNTALTKLRCQNNQLQNLDLSNNKALIELGVCSLNCVTYFF